MKWIERYYQGEYKNQLIKERGFVANDEDEEESNLTQDIFIGFYAKHKAKEESNLTMNSLIKKFSEKNTLKDEDDIPVTAIMASAGSGKTILLRRMVKQMMKNNGLIQSNNYLPSTDSLFDVIHYIELASKTRKDSTSLAEFLFEGYFKEQSDVEKAYEHLYQNQDKFVLCFDGLDQAPWDLTNENMTDVLPYDKADTATIMYNLLSRNLLPHVRIVITSREFKISTLPGKSKPEHIIALTGLKFEDVKTLFESLLEPDGEKFWKKINKFSQRSLLLMSTPLFLILSAIVTARYPDLPPPTTITELFNRIMHCLPQSDNIQERDQIFQVVTKLKVLAHQIMEKGKIVFRETDLAQHSLNMRDVRDLVMKVPGKSILARHLMDGSSLLCFCHQSFQEFFSASHISEMSLENFENFSKSYLMSDQWTVVSWFICGIIFGPDSNDWHNVSDRERKKAILKENFLAKLNRATGYHLINFLMAMYETNDYQMVQSCPKELDMEGTTLNSDQVHLLSSFLVKRKEIHVLNLIKCGLDDELIKIMSSNLEDSNVHIKVLQLDKVFHQHQRRNALPNIFSFRISHPNCLSREHLNSFLRYLNVDEVQHNRQIKISDFLKWNNVSRLKWNDALFTKTGSFVRIKDHSFTGSMDTKENKVVISPSNCGPNSTHSMFEAIEFLEEVLDSNTLKIVKVSTKQWLAWEDVERLNDECGYDMNTIWTIPNVLLYTIKLASDDVQMIKRFVDRFQVEILDLVIDRPSSEFSFDGLTSLKLQCQFRTHLCFCVSGITEVYEVINSNVYEIENMRIQLHNPVSSDDIVKLFQNCKQKIQTVCFIDRKGDILSESDTFQAFQTAKKFGIKFEYRIKKDVPQDAWYECDFRKQYHRLFPW